MTEAVAVAVFVALFFGSYILAGAIDARLQSRHPTEFSRLGNFIDSRPLNRDSLPHASRWLKFLLWENFKRGDLVLSGLCLSSWILLIAVIVVGRTLL